MKTVLHIITGLGRGGAEGVLFRLASSHSAAWNPVVVSLTNKGVYGARLEACGIAVHALQLQRGWLSFQGLRALYRIVRSVRPDVVQTWMYHADLIGGLIARSAGVKAVVWGIRNSNLSPATTSPVTRGVMRLCSMLSSKVPAAIACCSSNAAEVHVKLGYVKNKIVVIPNGFDLTRFAPDREARERVRREWGVLPTVPLVGCVARWDPQKDHETLLRAIRMLAERVRDIHLALVGPGMAPGNDALESLIDQLGVRGRIIMAGPREDVAGVMNALDLHVLSSSYGEAFPNVVAESMACETPSLSTDVGDASLIIGGCGWIVPPSDPGALAAAIEEVLRLDAERRAEIARRGRQRVAEAFGIDKMTNAYESLWGQNATNTASER